ncbi:DnaB-like helicase N-terminal domain-containing protein [Streptomyces sp. NPDC058417]|uniref:DnaB-like helicase N-terminal domain-containing protein n=1 Tax=unclassified Streptomyces TaxID=2593676 RepID=UPI003665536C
MPHTPEPDEDDLDTLAPPQPVFHVEQALLGALLLDPHRQDDITGIAADSFSTAAHAALYGAITTLPRPDPAEHATDTQWLDRVLAQAQERARGLTASYLHALVQVCPWPRHAGAYARMVEAEHARRRMQKAAERLVHAAHNTTFPHPVRNVLAEADALTTLVDDIAERFPPRAGMLPHTAAPPPAAPDLPEVVEEEQILLATATAHPADLDAVRWLVPDDLTVPLHGGLWQCLTALARRREPVDPVTVLWEAQLRGLLEPGRDPGEVLRMLSQPHVAVEHWGERVLRRSLLATAGDTGRRIGAYAADPANTPFQLVVGARRGLAGIAAVRARWQHAAEGTPPRRQGTAPTARAGPPTTRAAHPARSTRTNR